jgi:hypothetical protein
VLNMVRPRRGGGAEAAPDKAPTGGRRRDRAGGSECLILPEDDSVASERLVKPKKDAAPAVMVRGR